MRGRVFVFKTGFLFLKLRFRSFLRSIYNYLQRTFYYMRMHSIYVCKCVCV